MNHDFVNEIACQCLMGRARLLSRILTNAYDEELRSLGLKASQLNLLVVVAQAGPIRRTEIGRMIHLDPSTLTRNLQVMLTNGWIKEVALDQDGRGMALQATGMGKDLLESALPAWKKAQRRAGKLLGKDGSELLLKLSASFLEPAHS